MGQKVKFILVGLIGVAVIFIFLYLQALGSKEQLVKEHNNLKSEHSSLLGRVEKINSDLRDAQNKMSSLRSELDAISSERDELQRKYEMANRTRDELMEKLQSQTSQSQASMAVPPVSQSDEYWASVLKEKTDLQIQLDNVRNELQNMRIKNDELVRDKGALELEIDNLKRQGQELQNQIEYNKMITDNIAQELVWEKNEGMKIKEGMQPLKKENSVLTRQLKAVNKQKVSLEKKLQRLQEDKSGLTKKLTDMETMLVDKISQIDNLKNELQGIQRESQGGGRQPETAAAGQEKKSVELPPIVVRPEEAAAPSPAEPAAATPQQGAPQSGGSVLTVNRDSNFVIVDIGEDAGVSVGTSFRVERGGNPVGVVEVIKTSKSVSACDIKEEKAPIKVGDVVR